MAVFSTFHSKVSSATPHNKVRFCQWLGMLVWAPLGGPGKPHWSFGGWEMGPTLIKYGLFGSFFYFSPKGRYYTNLWPKVLPAKPHNLWPRSSQPVFQSTSFPVNLSLSFLLISLEPPFQSTSLPVSSHIHPFGPLPVNQSSSFPVTFNSLDPPFQSTGLTVFQSIDEE